MISFPKKESNRKNKQISIEEQSKYEIKLDKLIIFEKVTSEIYFIIALVSLIFFLSFYLFKSNKY